MILTVAYRLAKNRR